MLDWFRAVVRLPPGASSFADAIDGLHLFVLLSTLIGAAIMTGVTVYWLARYRRRTDLATTPRIVASRGRELTLIGALLALFLLWWVIGYREYLRQRERPRAARVVYVTAKQWMWKFSYPDGRTTLNELIVPVGEKVELIMTSRDVIHSFYVPAFRVKQDVLPGRYVSAWFEPTRAGDYRLICAEYCGLSHSVMGGIIHVLPQRDFEQASSHEPGVASLAARGREISLKHACFSCHTVDGRSHIGPSFSGLYGSRVTLADGTLVTADAEYLTRSMMDPALQLVAGYSPVMPTYQGSLSQPEVGAILEYLRSLAATDSAGGEP